MFQAMLAQQRAGERATARNLAPPHDLRATVPVCLRRATPPVHLNLSIDYALRLLMLLAAEPGRLHTIAEAARRYRVSRSHLMKVAMDLVRGGFVDSVRGRGGGLQLARAADAIRIGAVVRHFEGDLDLVECFDATTSTCSVAGGCRLKGVLREAGEAFLAVLDRYSVDDLVGKPALARSLLRQLAA